MKSIYDVFEFPIIRERLKKYASTELGKNYCDSLEMFSSSDDLALSLEELNEGIKYCYKYSRLSIQYHSNLIPHLSTLKKGGVGSKDFFYQVSFLLENIKQIKQEFKEGQTFVILNDLINHLDVLDNVKNRIDRVISPTLDILDSASSNLSRIRSKISHLENSISSLSNELINKYRNYLSENRGALRNGIFTLMVKSSFKNRIQGIVHDTSDTGLTVFIEPQELIEVYNKISSLKEEEIREIQSILKDLSNYVANYSNELLNDNFLISKLDFILAKASFCISYNGEICRISKEKKINLLNAAHPLIDKNKVVRNDFIIDKERMMVITGPNAGGKTVALKVIGLMVIMHQCGLALPIKEGGELPFFDNIYASIGDNQSILDNLSTFSSHIISIKNILSDVNDNSLVIIDELGSGTSPLDGEALGLGVIDYLLNKKCFALISSHYEAIKSYALENSDILCASMIFDEKNILPTYKLRLYVASSSYGIEVSERLGLQSEVIHRAKEYVNERKISSKEIKLELLNKRIEEVENIKIDLLEKEKQLESERNSILLEQQKNKEIRNKILLDAEEEKRKIIEQAKKEIDEIFNDFKKLENKKLHEVIAAKRMIENKANLSDEDDIVSNEILSINDNVEIVLSKTKGRIIRIDKDKASILTESGLTIQTKLNGLRKINIVKKKKNRVYTPDYVATLKSVPTECNVIGYTLKEALEIVKKYLDDAVVVHYKQVRIIHGSGTGKLRSGIQEYLKSSVYVDSYRLGGAGEGGVGATVVYLK